MADAVTHPGSDDSHHGPDGNAGDGAGGEDPAGPLGPGWVDILIAVIFLDLKLGHVSHLQDDDELRERESAQSGIIKVRYLTARKQGLTNFQHILQ